MRVYAANASPVKPAAAAPRRPAEAGFSVAAEKGAPASGGAGAVRTLGGIDALLALQAFDDPGERRRRRVGRGRNALDALDALKVGLLAGTLDADALARLRTAAAALGDEGGEDPRLDAIMAEIALRAEVELAKVEKVQGRSPGA